MAMIPVNNVSEFGIISDLEPHELPINAWSAGRNVRFNLGFLEKSLGNDSLWGGASIPPYWLLNARDASSSFWIYAGLTAVYATDGSTHADITRLAGAYGATADLNWTGGVFNGVPILNNTTDVPQYWPLSLALGNKLTALTNWNSTWRAGALRMYKNYLVALDISKSGVRYNQMVKWSHPADPGTVPTSWDETDPTKDAGEYSLAETGGTCVDCVPLRDTNIVYKNDSIWGMQYIGGQYIFRFYGIARQQGILSRRCAVEFVDGQHAVFGSNEIFIHNGQVLQPIATKKVKNAVYNAIDSNHFFCSFTVHLAAKHEVWFCYPETGNTIPNKALVWCYDTNSFGFRDLSAAHIEPGVESTSDTSFDTESDPFDGFPGQFDVSLYASAYRRLLEASPLDSKILLLDDSYTFDGTNMTSYIERTGLSVPVLAGQPPDVGARKMITSIWPRITGTAGGIINVYLGSQETIDGSVVYQTAKQYTIGTTRHVDFRISGRLFAVKFESTTNIEWQLHGYELDVKPLGRF